MITLVHGDDLEKIENHLVEVSSKKKLERIEASKIKTKELEEKLLGESLFGDERLYLIESFFKNKGKKELLGVIQANRENISLVFVERVKLTKRDLAFLKFDHISEYFLPQYYFKFLDEFYPKNGANLSNLYVELLKTMTAEQVFYSLVKRIRALIAVKFNLTTHSEIARFAPWQLGKLKSQARMWEEKTLADFYKKLYEVEVKMKSGGLPVTLEKYLDILIRTELN